MRNAEHKGKFHGRVVLAARPPYTDEEVHGDKRNLIKHEHSEEVDRDKEAEHTSREEDEPEEEFLGLRDSP